jgi:cell wall-associated NlpC family hydrolase
MTHVPVGTKTDAREPAAPVLGYSVVAVPLTDVRRTPDAGSELVNQALLGTPAARLEETRDAAWTRVRLPDYEGWVVTTALAPEQAPTLALAPEQYVRVIAVTTPLQVTNPDGTAEEWTVFAGTLLRPAEPLEQARVIVDLPDGRTGVIDRQAVVPVLALQTGRGDAASVLATARQFLTTPYLWGGLSVHGIDCSGFMQTVYRVHGYTLPRDADEQFATLPTAVEHGAWQPGDLLFFGGGPDEITHVGMFIGDSRVIHATAKSSPPSVVIQALDPAAADYSPRLVNSYVGARRVIVPGAAR